MKGQFGLMEYLLMTVLVLVVVLFAVFFLFGFESSKVRMGESAEEAEDILFAMGLLAHSDLLTHKEMMFDDSKLMSFTKRDRLGPIDPGCEVIKELSGRSMCVTVAKVLLAGENRTECDYLNYPKCNSWTICEDVCRGAGKSTLADSPVNIYQAMSGKVELGILTVKIPREV